MPQLILPRRFTQQPQGGAEVDWSNPLSLGLIGLVSVQCGVVRDAVSGNVATIGAQTPIINTTPMGQTISVDNTADIEYWTIALNPIPALSAVSMAMVVRQTGGSTNPRDFARLFAGARGSTDYLRIQGDTDGQWGFGYRRAGIGERLAMINNPGTNFVTGSVTWSGTITTGYLEQSSAVSTTAASGAWPAGAATLDIGDATLLSQVSDVAIIPIWSREITASEHLAFMDAPLQIFKAAPRVLYFDLGAAGVTGTISYTLSSFTSSLLGTTTIVGNIAQTLSATTSTITGTTEDQGTIAVTLQDDVSAISGSIGSAISGTITNTLDNTTNAITGTTGVVGNIASTLEDSNSSISGTTTIIGIISTTLGEVVSSMAGTTTIIGTIAVTLADAISSIYDSATSLVKRFLTLLGVGS